jgi:3-oxoacyl-[acyl-carrier protein] reductase
MDFQLNHCYKQIYIVTPEIYSHFQVCSKDNNPLHVNEEFARLKGFDSKVMYGNILNAFISHFIGECLPTKEVVIHSQTISFNNPVYLNEILNFQAIVADIFESVNVIEFKYKFVKPNGKTAAKGKIKIGILI